MPISVRISDLDSCQQTPTHLDQFQHAPKVPIIRIYGALRLKQLSYNVLVHVHNFYPYLYIDCPERDWRRVDDTYISKLSSFLDGCLAESFSRQKNDFEAEEDELSDDDRDENKEETKDNDDENIIGTAFSKTSAAFSASKKDSSSAHGEKEGSFGGIPSTHENKHTLGPRSTYIRPRSTPLGNGDPGSLSKRFIASVACCRACPVYGYTVGYSVKLKILLLLPTYKTRLFRLLNENKIDFLSFSSSSSSSSMHEQPALQIYEAHINYFSQFLADYNLYGCGWLDIDNFYIRSPIFTSNSLLGNLKSDLEEYVATNNILNPMTYPRMGRSLLEIDIHIDSVLNRTKLRQRDVHNDFTEFVTPTPQQHIYLSSLRLTLDDLKFQCESRGRHDTSQILNELYSQVFTKLGQRGYADWEFSAEHKHQLAYVSKLNKPTECTNTSQFFEENLQQVLPPLSIPTAFELVTETTAIDFYEKVPKLNFRDDLVSWTKIDALFVSEISNEFRNLALVSSPLLSDLEDLDPLNGADFVEKGKHEKSDFVSRDAKHTIIPSSPISEMPSSPNRVEDHSPHKESNGSYESPSKVSTLDKDLEIFNQTQGRLPQQYLNLLMDSASSLTQTSSFLLRNPKAVYEYLLPNHLTKLRFKDNFFNLGMMEHDYHDPSYYSKSDVHEKPLIFANKKIVVPLKHTSSIRKFHSTAFSLQFSPRRKLLPGGAISTWQYAVSAPTRKSVAQCVDSEIDRIKYKRQKFRTQIEPALTQTYDFKHSHEVARVKRGNTDFLNLTLLHMELHVNKDSSMHPDPITDEISMLIFHFEDTNCVFNKGLPIRKLLISSKVLSEELKSQLSIRRLNSLIAGDVSIHQSEKEMIDQFCSLVDYYDPDVLSGFEVNSSSWGFLCERFQAAYNTNMMARLSRVQHKGNGKFGDRWGYTHTSVIKINGRHMLNLWRLFRLELALTSYSLENVCLHILHHTLPKVSNLLLSKWFQSSHFAQLLLVCKYYQQKIDVIMRIVEIKELILKNVELSRLIGIDFYSNFYRGSQFKVESILIRIAKPENLLLNSPSKLQVHNMRPLEVIPLIMEPDSAFYKSPLVVLDFQSLYPSIMIAYNYCYSTFLGKMEGFKQTRNPIGYMKHHQLQEGIIELLNRNDGINISPNGLLFASSKFRKSILSRMLQEILNMRINVKTVASAFSEEKELQKLYNSKQLALKLIANVTYGYTSASFSGRMPSSDIADAIVATGREVMRKAISIIEASEHNAKVVYGDTDSLFVYFPGKSKEDAFKYGRQLAQAVTEVFPDPIKLKFEKVYHPCVLLAKKRYVGNCFEHEMQKTAKFEAKGIETIRRDGVPAQLKMVGKSLRILFESKNLSMVKSYVLEQFHKVLQNKVNVSDFCFAKEVRHGTYKNEKYLPPGAVIAKRLIKNDPRREPQYRERVPYVVIRDSLKERVKDRSVTPEEYVESFTTLSPMELDYEYYITRVLIPPLERIFNLMGVNIKEWYRDMPRSTKINVMKKNDIFHLAENVFRRECLNCGQLLAQGQKWVCTDCENSKPTVVADMVWSVKAAEHRHRDLSAVCETCCFLNLLSLLVFQECVNHDCRIYYSKLKAEKELSQSIQKLKILDEL